MFNIKESRQKILAIQKRMDFTQTQLAKEIGVSWNTMLHILHDGYSGYKEVAHKTRQKIRKFIAKYEGK